MSGRGGNLKQPLKKVLINVPGPANLGVYMDSVSGRRVLQFKHHGFSLPWIPGSTFVVQEPVLPVMKVAVVNISNVAPVDRLDYPFGITVLSRHREPGVDNSEVFPHQKFYGGVLPSVTSPTISAAELNSMRDQIIAQINSDNGFNTRRPANQFPGSAVIAGVALNLANWNAASAMTLDGITFGAQATIAAFVNSINLNANYIAVATGATTLTVMRRNRLNTPIVFAMTLGTISNASGNGEIALLQRYADLTFEVGVRRASFATTATLQRTVFALMTPDEVFQVFSHLPNYGFLAQEVRNPNLPLNVPYVKWVIEIPQEHSDLGGASHSVIFENALEVYIPQTEWTAPVARWEAIAANRSMDAGTATTVVQLMNLWRT